MLLLPNSKTLITEKLEQFQTRYEQATTIYRQYGGDIEKIASQEYGYDDTTTKRVVDTYLALNLHTVNCENKSIPVLMVNDSIRNVWPILIAGNVDSRSKGSDLPALRCSIAELIGLQDRAAVKFDNNYIRYWLELDYNQANNSHNNFSKVRELILSYQFSPNIERKNNHYNLLIIDLPEIEEDFRHFVYQDLSPSRRHSRPYRLVTRGNNWYASTVLQKIFNFSLIEDPYEPMKLIQELLGGITDDLLALVKYNFWLHQVNYAEQLTSIVGNDYFLLADNITSRYLQSRDYFPNAENRFIFFSFNDPKVISYEYRGIGAEVVNVVKILEEKLSNLQ